VNAEMDEWTLLWEWERYKQERWKRGVIVAMTSAIGRKIRRNNEEVQIPVPHPPVR